MKKILVLLLIIAFFFYGLFSSEDRPVEELENKLKRVSGKERVDILNKLAFRHHVTKKVFEYGNQALALSRKLKYKKGEGTALYYIGIGYDRVRKNTEALECGQKALKIFEEIKNKLRKATGLNQIWPLIVDHLEAINYDIEIIKKLIPGNMIRAILNNQELRIRELIYYLNVSRTFVKAREFYIPGNKIETEVHFFKASLEKIYYESWARYCKQPIKVYQVTGDHYSIFKMPEVAAFAKLFDEVLKEILFSGGHRTQDV